MTATTHRDFTYWLSATFAPIINEYHLKVIGINACEALVIGPNYALLVGADRDGVEVEYIDRDQRHQLAVYGLRSLTMERFTPEDRSNYGQPSTKEERLVASLNVYAAGLANRCRDVLSGDKSWLKRDRWQGLKLNSSIEQILSRELP